MNSTDPSVLDWWMAYYRVEPFGDRWAQTATIAVEVANVRDTWIRTKTDLSGVARPRFEDFMPADAKPPAQFKAALSIEASKCQLAALAGVPPE